MKNTRRNRQIMKKTADFHERSLIDRVIMDVLGAITKSQNYYEQTTNHSG